MAISLPNRFCIDASASVSDTPRERDVSAEARLLTKLGHGELAALDELWECWKKPLFAIALRSLANTGDAEEALQDLLVRIWKKAGEYDPALSQPFSWAVMMLRGLVMDKLRARSRRPVLVEATAEREAFAAADGPGLQGDFEIALARLTSEERQTLEMAVFHPGTNEELATRLGQPLGTIKTRLKRAVEKLRSALTE